MNKAYKERMEDLRFSAEQKEKMVERLMEAQERQETKMNRKWLKIKPVAAAAAAVAVLTMGAGAVYSGLASDAFASVFGNTHTEIIDKIGKPIGVSDTDAGVTVTVDAILGDKHNLNVVFTMEKQDGTSWGLDENHDLMIDGELQLGYMGGSHGSSWFVDEDPEDDRVQYVQQITVDEESGIKMGRTKAVLENLRLCNTKTAQVEQEFEGKWKLRFDLQYEDSSVSLLKQPLSIKTGAGNAIIDEATISPIGFRVKGYYETLKEEVQAQLSAGQPESGREPEDSPWRKFTDFDIELHKKDGSIINLSKEAGSSVSLQEKTFIVGNGFQDTVYDLDALEAISIAGVVLPIEAK